jgi:CheY-like chemotaxis protein
VEPPQEEKAPERAALDHITETRLDAVRVLVVDDDEETRQVLRALLEEAGATVDTANGAEAARHALHESSPDVLISDIAMPEEDGYTLIRSLRASNVTTPAIALTAMARREDTAAALAAGFHMYMLKPADPGELIRAVGDLSGSPHARAHH